MPQNTARPGRRAWEINLDEHFRPDSAARTVAERLLTGRPQTRQELVDGLGISVTTVNRVAELLAQAGAVVVRDTAPDGRQATFRVADVQEPRNRVGFPMLGEEMTIAGAWRVGDQTVLDLTTDKSRYRGELKSLMRMVPLGKRVRVTGMRAAGEGLADLQFQVDEDEKEMVVDSVRNVTE